jgi:hypothetical protein
VRPDVGVPPPIVSVPPDTKPKDVALAIGIAVQAEGGPGKTTVMIQGGADCSELPPPPASCNTKLCRKLRTTLAKICETSGAVSIRTVGVRIVTGLVPVLRTFSRSFGGSKGRSVHARVALNRLGSLFFRQNGRLPIHGELDVHDRQGQSIRALFQTLLRRG